MIEIEPIVMFGLLFGIGILGGALGVLIGYCIWEI